jgi:uncharacterized protein YjbJ (UPF0337 family)
MATQLELRGNWNEIVGGLKRRWGQLTDDELSSAEGNLERLIGTVQRKTGETRSAIEKYLGEVLDEANASGFAQQAKEYADQTREQIQHAATQAAKSVQEGYQEAKEVAKSHPLETALAAFGVGMVGGLVVGWMIRR